MKKKFLNIIFIPLLVLLSSCGAQDTILDTDQEIKYLDDNYRNIYEIFPYSFSDSNADGIGDLNGIIDKFDYIKDLNYSGIWLTPVHQSNSYHKYDVDDYKSIDSSFGTLSDYDNLVKKCHENNMTILMDLVINHSSVNNLWFEKCIIAHSRNLVNDQYYNYYNVQKYTSGMTIPSGWNTYGDLIYESQFYSGMPDLNLQYVLDYPNGYLANDLKDIFKFWLIYHDIDGFRLDAVTSYFTGFPDKNLLFLEWLNKEIKSIKPTAYIVGEGSWGNANENKKYYTSGCDGFFMFEDAQSSGYIAQAISKQDATMIPYAIKKNLDIAGTGIPAPFIANHDTGRLTGAVRGRNNASNVKFGNGLLQMMNGCTYSYYGDEVGMTVYTGTSDIKDEDKRLPLPWGDKYQCKPVKGSTAVEDSEKYPYGTIATQQKDSNSILNYVKKANRIRLENIEIARGSCELVYESDDESLCVTRRTFDTKSVYVAINCSSTSEKKYNFSNIGGDKVVGQLVTSSYIKQANKDIKEITIPPQGIAIIR